MPKVRRTPRIETRLAREDFSRFETLVKETGRTRTEVVREAVLHYLDCAEPEPEIQRVHERDRLIVNALKSMENRYSGLLVRLGIDLETVVALLWASSPKDSREKLFAECKRVGQERFRRTLDNVEKEARRRLRTQADEL